MRTQLLVWATLVTPLAGGVQFVRGGGEDKVHEVGAGLKIVAELGEPQAIAYKVKLTSGKTYVIDMISPNQKALNPFLRLLDPNGKQLAEDDDGGEGMNARIIQKVQATTTFQIVATCFGNGRGPFKLTIREAKVEDRALTKEEQQKLLERDALLNQANQLIAKARFEEANVAVGKALAVEKAILGDFHNDVVTSLEMRAKIHELREEFVEARRVRTEVMVLQAKVHDHRTGS